MREPQFSKNKSHVHRGAILTEKAVRRICRLWRQRGPKLSERRVAERFGVSRSCVNHIVSGRSWQHITLPLLFDITSDGAANE